MTSDILLGEISRKFLTARVIKNSTSSGTDQCNSDEIFLIIDVSDLIHM